MWGFDMGVGIVLCCVVCCVLLCVEAGDDDEG